MDLNKSCFLLLSKAKNEYIEELSAIFKPNSFIIYDTDYSDDLLKQKGFIGLTGGIKQPSAWDKSFYFISQITDVTNYSYFYFIEDDVFSKKIHNIKLLAYYLDSNYNSYDLIAHYIQNKSESTNWPWWDKIDVNLKNQYRSFNPFCRLSKKLVNSILDYRNNNNCFIFHEILFASLCGDHQYSTVSLDSNKEYNKFIGSIKARPILDKIFIDDEKIYHPVKPIYE